MVELKGQCALAIKTTELPEMPVYDTGWLIWCPLPSALQQSHLPSIQVRISLDSFCGAHHGITLALYPK